MVYGPGCKGNLPRMVQAIDRGRFPPLRETGNKRSMVDVRDVVQAALLAATHPVATGKMYIVTDGQAYSTRQIYEWILAALQRPVPRWTVPPALLRWAACMGDVIGYLGGRRFIFDTYTLNKLAESAWYSSSKICHELNYQPRHNLRDSIHEMVRAFKKAE
jgi:nucleoside-diphosphate-sugar epimerase